jgi:hypothetical protein
VQDDDLCRVQPFWTLSPVDLLAKLLDALAVDSFECHDACKCHCFLSLRQADT